MYLVYLDESGSSNDGSYTPGMNWQPMSQRESKYFILTALVLDQAHWKTLFQKLKGIRENVKVTHGVPLKEYIHATELVTGRNQWQHRGRRKFTQAKRIRLLKNLLHEYSQLKQYCYYGAVFVDKTSGLCNPLNCREFAYENLLNRLEKDLDKNYIIIHDGQEDSAIIRLLRKKRVFNFVSGQKFMIEKFIEDPFFKRAHNSYFLQAVDQISYVILHYYDDHLPNKDIGRLYHQSGLMNLGNGRMCYRTRNSEPGHIPVPARPL